MMGMNVCVPFDCKRHAAGEAACLNPNFASTKRKLSQSKVRLATTEGHADLSY
jgi:hypothetical protein